jgi:ABC-2 type transport system permease protein
MSNKELFWALLTLSQKELRRFLRIWIQTLVPPAITTALYFVIFGEVIGNNIDRSVSEGLKYIHFMIPGLIMLAVITAAYSNVVSSFYGVKFQRAIEELLISPMPNWAILLGYVIGGVVRAILVGIIVFIVSIIFEPSLQIHSYSLTILVLILTSIMFSLLGFINAIYADSFDDIAIVPTFVLTPLIYLGGVFYSIKMLPPLWQSISQVNPMLYVVNTFREGMLGISDVSITLSLLMMTAFIVIFFIICLYLLNKGVGIRE